jgi:hypothetical protein
MTADEKFPPAWTVAACGQLFKEKVGMQTLSLDKHLTTPYGDLLFFRA